MENEGLIKKFIKIYVEIERKCLHPQFSFPGGGKVTREMETFTKQLNDRFGEVSELLRMYRSLLEGSKKTMET